MDGCFVLNRILSGFASGIFGIAVTNGSVLYWIFA